MTRSNFSLYFVMLTALLWRTGVFSAPVPVTGVTMQHIGGTEFKITYSLSTDAIVTLGIEDNSVLQPDTAVANATGDVWRVVNADSNKTIIWDAGFDWPNNYSTKIRARVEAWTTDSPPPVMVVDLSGGVDAESFPVYYYLSVATLPYGGLASSIYRSSRIVLQRISGGTFVMGSGADVKEVTLTQDYYTGIFEITQEQWRRVMDGSPAKYTEVASRGYRPVESVSYNDIRGSTTEARTIDWPTSGSDVGADSFLDILRTKSAIAFDLPTEAQWEYACRAGTATAFHDGYLAATTLAPENKTNQWLDVLGRYQYNGGYRLSSGKWVEPTASYGSSVATAMAGSYLPNAWGLYDMHGNVWEWCLDWFDSELPGGTNPGGKDASASGTRVCRGGGFTDNPDSCLSASRTSLEPDTTQSDTGFRIVYALP